MVRSHLRAKRKITSGKYISFRKKKISELAGNPILTSLQETKKKSVRIRSGCTKQKMLTANLANVFNPKTKKSKVVKIKTIVENPANRHYVRRNIMTKGAIIDTELGKAKVTSRPGQEGTLNAVLI
ncbi:MAG: 30S ribosomal protein S8e [Candidatus Nanoarchaeia archaeon]|nr:30S ribosomal protein S8e [Candidatus Nanoarchaeia archaeon]MDD5587918.1 30S ribosomal protein S8e [Candidatus Nanoarchaeia archaeon]